MKLSDRSTTNLATTLSIMGLVFGSCTTSQPEFECAAVNGTTYQMRYYKDEANSTCPADSGYITDSLLGGSAGMESYMLLSPNGSGGPDVYFTNTTDKLDRSATKIVLRLDTLLSSVVVNACDNNLLNNCSAPDRVFSSPCDYCLTIVGDGGTGTTYTLPDGTDGVDPKPSPDGGIQGVEKPTADGGVKRISLSNRCVPGKKDNVTRTADKTPDPNLSLIVPRYGPKGICTSIDGGTSTSRSVFPEVTCQDSTKLPAVEVTTTLSNYKLLASASVPGFVAKAQLTFEEKLGSNTCKTMYRVVILAPQIECHTDLDCSPDPVKAPKCPAAPELGDYCLSGTGATTLLGSQITPNLFNKLSDGGFDLKNKCDPDLNYCIWDVDAGGI